MDDDDASANSGEEIYNKVVVQAQTPDGAPMRVQRTQGQQTGTMFGPTTSPAPLNPSFDVDTSGWTATGSVITRDTTTFDTGPGAGRWDNTGASDALAPNATLEVAFKGTFIAGVTYRLWFLLRGNVNAAPFLNSSFGAIAQGDTHSSSFLSNVPTTFTAFAETWTPTRTYTSGVTFRLTRQNTSGTTFFWVDSLQLLAVVPTLVDRRGFTRTMILPVQSALPADGVAAGVIGDLWLAGHKTTPFKGTVTLTGDGALRNVLTGVDVPLEQLLLNTGQLVRFSDRSDPDTGGHGRDGRIVQVSYQPATDTAQVTFDNSRTDISTLLSRLAAVQGG